MIIVDIPICVLGVTSQLCTLPDGCESPHEELCPGPTTWHYEELCGYIIPQLIPYRSCLVFMDIFLSLQYKIVLDVEFSNTGPTGDCANIFGTLTKDWSGTEFIRVYQTPTRKVLLLELCILQTGTSSWNGTVVSDWNSMSIQAQKVMSAIQIHFFSRYRGVKLNLKSREGDVNRFCLFQHLNTEIHFFSIHFRSEKF